MRLKLLSPRRQVSEAKRAEVLAFFLVLALSMAISPAIATNNPWASLQKPDQNTPPEVSTVNPAKVNDEKSSRRNQDPWARLQAIFLPFSEQEEIAATNNPKRVAKVSHLLHRKLQPYETIINEAANIFHIPPEVIGAVIMVESGGNPSAQAKSSTASGLMQTIRSTFKEARQRLMNMGLKIKDTPFDPRASIMAGSWYLSQMFEQVKDDGKAVMTSRKNIPSWHLPAEYYYAGPGNGRKDDEKVIIYSGGKQIIIDKPAYSQKVMRWAEILKG